ncbi:hypothetical protein SAMN05421823_104130 [Catalinimonas alkaloidigena]|uniref:Uncharacterized protein n=1 Tax=Catalinimonas alkaloidigena TaxID=1075417 RepID=A0A1G9GJF3_9BACT|nr:hypothetical protein [Catalinimonas alkaloidigena]SDL00799.1 hypothetical protein SAMN05421823_104130 [Catalinimonas alkaloidigena]
MKMRNAGESAGWGLILVVVYALVSGGMSFLKREGMRGAIIWFTNLLILHTLICVVVSVISFAIGKNQIGKDWLLHTLVGGSVCLGSTQL